MSSENGHDAAVVPAIGTTSSVAAIRSLGKAGVETVAVSADQSPPAFFSRYCAETVSVPSPAESLEAYAESLLELVARDDVKTVLPLREADVYVLADNRSAFAAHVDPVWPTFETLRKAQDRHTLLSVADDLDVPTPATQLLTEWPESTEPLVIKPRYTMVVDGERAGAYYPSVEVVEPEETPAVDEVVDEMSHTPLVQEFVPNGGEYGFFALYDHGEPVVTFQHERVRSSTYTGGHSVYRKAIHDTTLERYGRQLLDELEWHGPAMVEFRRDRRSDTLYLMEINPRFWGSLALPIRAGVDFPYCYYRLATGDRQCASGDYRTDVGVHIAWGELAYLFSVWAGEEHGEPPPLGREVLDVVRSVFRQPSFDCLSVTDPLPFFVNLRNIGRELVS